MTSSLRQMADLFDVLPDAVLVVDGLGRIAFANAAVFRVLGYRADELSGRPHTCLIPHPLRARHEEHQRRFLENGRPGAMGTRPVLYALSKAGQELPVSISIANIELDDGRYSVAVVRDAAVVRDQLRAAITQAETDTLTGLGNRLHLSSCLQTRLTARRPFALLFLDLSKFKRFNDERGHQSGDEVLRLVAKRLQGLVRANDVAIRYGGDEFVILLDKVADPDLVAARSAAVVSSIEQPFKVDGISATIGVNVGAAMYPRDGASEETLVSLADRNMYRAKQRGVAYILSHDRMEGAQESGADTC